MEQQDVAYDAGEYIETVSSPVNLSRSERSKRPVGKNLYVSTAGLGKQSQQNMHPLRQQKHRPQRKSTPFKPHVPTDIAVYLST